MALRFNMYPDYGQFNDHEKQQESWAEFGTHAGNMLANWQKFHSAEAKAYNKYVDDYGREKERLKALYERDRDSDKSEDDMSQQDKDKYFGQYLAPVQSRDSWAAENQSLIDDMKRQKRVQFAKSPLGRIFMKPTSQNNSNESGEPGNNSSNNVNQTVNPVNATAKYGNSEFSKSFVDKWNLSDDDMSKLSEVYNLSSTSYPKFKQLYPSVEDYFEGSVRSNDNQIWRLIGRDPGWQADQNWKYSGEHFKDTEDYKLNLPFGLNNLLGNVR